ncbi:MAG: AAA family ATPase partial [Methanobrevibacter sp. CfCl-M3]
MNFSPISRDITPMLFQTGYLTVKSARIIENSLKYKLDFPNHEVEESFYLNLLAEITDNSESDIQFINHDLKKYLISADEKNMKMELKVMVSNIPNLIHEHSHNYYQSSIISWLFGAGFNIIGEYNLAKGRIDGAITIEDTAVIVEVKFDDDESLEKLIKTGLKQIHAKKYYEKFIKDYKVNLLGIAISNKEIDCRFEKLNY